MAVPVLLGIGSILTWISSAIATVAGAVITFMTGRMFLRAAALTVASSLFATMFIATYNLVLAQVQSAVTTAQTAAAGSGLSIVADGINLGLCMLPSTIPAAITVIFNIVIMAIILRYSRMILFSKATG